MRGSVNLCAARRSVNRPAARTQKVQKHLLRDDGVTSDTRDREKAGIVIRREHIA
jgi:crotonobetaine/carnitine-CoA ligase